MPFTPMTGLELPADTATVWRYMDRWKFVSMLQTSALYFARSDRFSDRWDSVLPSKWREKMQRDMGDRPDGGKYTQATWYEEREIPTNPICCFNCDENESERMWREYTRCPGALVIRSTVGRLKECFSSTLAQVRIGLVKYGYHDDLDDPQFALVWRGDNEPVATLNPWYVPRYLKRVDFAYEKEIRASIHVKREDRPIDPGYNLVIGSAGIRKLIESVHMHPNTTIDQLRDVTSRLDEAGFGDIPVQPSTLKACPRT